MTETNVYRLNLYCALCDVGYHMAFSTLHMAMFTADKLQCKQPNHKTTIDLTDDFGLEEDRITWETIRHYLATR